MDETQPLLNGLEAAHAGSVNEAASDIVDFDPNGDVENPVDWPKSYKWSVVALLAFMAFTVTFTCISVVPVANRIVYDLDGGRSSKSASVLLVTVWELGEAFGPLCIAPLSEVFGRYPVINAANVLFLVATILAAISQSAPLFIAARALTGLAVASNVLSPAIVGDMFKREEQGSPMSLIMLAPLVGGAVGPAISGAVTQSLGWRQVIWMSALLAAVAEIVFLLCFRETYKVKILRQKAARLRKQTGNVMLKTEFDADSEVKGDKKMWKSIMRPFVVLYGSRVLQLLSLFGSVAFTYFYLMSTSLPGILEDIYKLSPAEIGAAFLCFSLGSAVSVVFMNFTLDRIFVKLRDRNGGIAQAEHRLPVTILGGFTLPLVITWYGWIAQERFSLGIFLLSFGLLGMTLELAILPLMAYVVDAFGVYSASALTALIVCRCLTSTFLPLASGPLVDSLGYGLGFTMFGILSMCLAPLPVLVLLYGSNWRQRSPYTRDEVHL